MTEKTDEELVLLTQEGDAESFGALVGRFESKLLRYGRKFLARHEDIEDMVQNAFLKAYMNIRSFDVKQKFSPWMYRIAHNEFVNALKKKGREPLFFFDPDTLFPHPIANETADDETNRNDFKKTLDFCLDKLGPKYREPLVLFYFEEMNYQDIAEVLHIPVSTVGVRLQRGRAALKKLLSTLN